MKPAVVCAGDAGINALATVRSLGRRGVPVDVVALESSRQLASASRYCRRFIAVRELAALPQALVQMEAGALLYVDNDPMLILLAPHAEELGRRFALTDPLAEASRLTDKVRQVRVARDCGIAVPRSWSPHTWDEMQSLKTRRRLIAKPLQRAGFKALLAENGRELAAALRERIAGPADVMVQEYVEGDDSQIYVALCYRARSTERCFVLSARKLRQSMPGAGVMAVGQVVDAPQVREMTRRLAKAAGARGAFCTEFKLDADDGRYYFIEWNARPAYFHSIGWRSGFDLAWLAYCDHAEPARLAGIGPAFSGEHYWISLQADMQNLSQAPRRTAAAWRPYLGPTEWAVFALDDLAPWRKAMRGLARWALRRKFFARASAAPVARRA
jgi:D-aspartate ligase